MNLARRFAFLLLLSVAITRADEPAILGYTEPYRTITVSASEQGVISEMLVEEGNATKKGQVLARLDTASFQAELEIAKAETKLQATRLKRLEELSTEIKRDPSEAVSAANPHVLTVVQVDKLLLNLFLPPARAATFQVGATVNLKLLEENVTTPAKVEFVSPITDSASGTVRVKFVIENANGTHRSGGRCTLAE